MDADTYNGWANRETWLVGLHLSNDKATDDEAHAIVYAAQRDWRPAAGIESFYEEDASRAARAKVFAAADALAEWVRDELIPELGGTAGELLAGDLIGGALSRVDWSAVAESFMPEDDENPLYPNGQCGACGHGLTDGGACTNDDCTRSES